MISAHPGAQSGSYTPTPLLNITYGSGSIFKLASLANEFLLPLIFPDGNKDKADSSDKIRVLIVTGKSLATKTPVISDVQQMLEKEGWEVTVHQGVSLSSLRVR